MTMFRENALRMKLHAMDGVMAVRQAHDKAVFSLSSDHKIIWQCVAFDDQRVIARRLKRAIDAAEDRLAFMQDGREFAVDGLRRAHDLAAIGIPDGLVTKADAKDRDCTACGMDQIRQIPASLGVQGPGESTIASGAALMTSPVLISSLRYTLTSAPRDPR